MGERRGKGELDDIRRLLEPARFGRWSAEHSFFNARTHGRGATLVRQIASKRGWISM